ncbi:MAG: hypothetical protein Q8K28_09490 [Hoeflea sp.]|uniref:hypothetical protein n=1 Tax=Hoeflea sp. TaxID=1940281 RepID=UPI002731EF5C|nr:hypothetical protein [Hoeflea sp.]MDP2120123.1 hypothetical protein [Hoeflea sp.]
MIVAFDNTFLSLALNPGTKPTPNPATGKPVDFCSLRVEALIDELGARGGTILIPTPCMAEMLCAVPDFERAIAAIFETVAFDPAPFDARCAIELADASRKARASGDKRSGTSAGWNEVKFDRQIAAIAKVGRASTFYTDDANQTKFAQTLGLEVKHTWDLDLPDKYRQQSLLDPQGNQ